MSSMSSALHHCIAYMAVECLKIGPAAVLRAFYTSQGGSHSITGHPDLLFRGFEGCCTGAGLQERIPPQRVPLHRS